MAAFSGAGKDWPAVRDMAMRGFIKCSDGRWYDKTLCEDALRAAQKKRERDERTKAATEARKRQRGDQRNDVRDVATDLNVTTSHRRDETRHGQDGTGQGRISNSAALAGSSVSDDQVDRLCSIAGVQAELTDNRLINSWLSSGLTIAQIERAVRLKLSRMDEPPKTLRFYDGVVRDALKQERSTTTGYGPQQRPAKRQLTDVMAADQEKNHAPRD